MYDYVNKQYNEWLFVFTAPLGSKIHAIFHGASPTDPLMVAYLTAGKSCGARIEALTDGL